MGIAGVVRGLAGEVEDELTGGKGKGKGKGKEKEDKVWLHCVVGAKAEERAADEPGSPTEEVSNFPVLPCGCLHRKRLLRQTAAALILSSTQASHHRKSPRCVANSISPEDKKFPTSSLLARRVDRAGMHMRSM